MVETERPIIEFANLTEAQEIIKAVQSTGADIILKNSAQACELFGFDLILAQMHELEGVIESGHGSITLCFDAGEDPIYAIAASEAQMPMVHLEGKEEVLQQVKQLFSVYKTQFMPQGKKRIDFWGHSNIYNECREWLSAV